MPVRSADERSVLDSAARAQSNPSEPSRRRQRILPWLRSEKPPVEMLRGCSHERDRGWSEELLAAFVKEMFRPVVKTCRRCRPCWQNIRVKQSYYNMRRRGAAFGINAPYRLLAGRHDVQMPFGSTSPWRAVLLVARPTKRC